MKIKLFIMSTAVVFTSLCFAAENKVPFPNDYRSWTHVKSMIIEKGHALENPFEGIHHVYANKKAIKGIKGIKIGKYSDGSVFVFDLLSADIKDLTIQESDRKLVGVMHKDARKFSKTGGWGFEGFASNSKTERLTTDGGKSCFGCHAPLESSDYVYSKFRY